MDEYAFIKGLAAKFSRSRAQRNKLFECDSEILELGNSLWGLTMDEFSQAEDLFSSESPEKLGANLAVATLSDLLAAGATPAFFMQALVLPRDVDSAFAEGLAEGIARTLEKAGCHLCGGDLGTADAWRYTGFAMGPISSGKPLTRILPETEQRLFATGSIGDANLAAFTKGATPQFELRTAEGEFIRKSATGCIDTSGGLLDALWTLKILNPSLRFDVALERIPYCKGLESFSAATGIPKEAALLGGAGEYELLFCSGKDSASIPDTLNVQEIGGVAPSSKPGIFLKGKGDRIVELASPLPCPRSFGGVDSYAQAIVSLACQLFGGGNKNA